MEITLKKVKTFTGTDGYGLNADVYVNGQKCFFYLDEANGGESHHYPIYNEALYKELEEYVKSLPEREAMEFFGPDEKFKPDIDTVINDALAKYEYEKLTKRLMKKTDFNIVAINSDCRYVSGNFGGGSKAIAWMVIHRPQKVIEMINTIKEKYPGYEVINTNIPDELKNKVYADNQH